nr:hypothetical protein [Roseomonas sp. KE2513]
MPPRELPERLHPLSMRRPHLSGLPRRHFLAHAGLQFRVQTAQILRGGAFRGHVPNDPDQPLSPPFRIAPDFGLRGDPPHRSVGRSDDAELRLVAHCAPIERGSHRLVVRSPVFRVDARQRSLMGVRRGSVRQSRDGDIFGRDRRSRLVEPLVKATDPGDLMGKP